MTYTITNNNQYNSIEIAFDGKPSEAVRDALKALRFRWHKVKKVWYGYADAEKIAAVLEGNEIRDEHVAEAAPDEIRAEYAKIWDTTNMVDYCTKKVASCAKLPTGELIPIEKQSILTQFCFGESGYDYDDALKSAAHARNSQEYFIHENMARFDRMLKDIEDHMHLSGDYLMALTGNEEKSRIRHISFEKITKILDDLGGSAHLDSLKMGQVIKENGSGRRYRIVTDEEARIILDAYKRAAAAHRKKLNSYLKRYGLTKVHAWTYWRDA